MRLAHPPTSCKVTTPSDLAKAIVQAVGDDDGLLWLEPSHGTGVFVEAISDLGVQKERIVAVDLDPKPSTADKLARTIRGVDFLRWARETDLRFDRIVGNPPFISIKRLPVSLQRTASSVSDVNGQPIGRAANVWYAFVLASLRLLKEHGSLAFVLPSAAEFADYSSAIRNVIGETFGSLELYRCARPLFEGVQEGTLVAVARDYKVRPCLVVRRARFQTKSTLIQGLTMSGRLNGHKCPTRIAQPPTASVTLASIAKIRVGGVTGHAAYFLMNEGRREALLLPEAALTPVVSKAKHLRSACLKLADWNDLKSSGERVWLFNPTPDMAKHPRVKDYLYLDADAGGCNRQAYKVSIRAPWYCTTLPERPDAFLSGMSSEGPWLCINDTRKLNATNTLYVLTFRSRDRQTWYGWALALLSWSAQKQIRRIGRRYADGLIKYEPGSLGEVVLPSIRQDVDHKSLYVRAVNALLASDPATARDIADSVRL